MTDVILNLEITTPKIPTFALGPTGMSAVEAIVQDGFSYQDAYELVRVGGPRIVEADDDLYVKTVKFNQAIVEKLIKEYE
jgi:hypothetical protein